jgi:hypothetical protein
MVVDNTSATSATSGGQQLKSSWRRYSANRGVVNYGYPDLFEELLR